MRPVDDVARPLKHNAPSMRSWTMKLARSFFRIPSRERGVLLGQRVIEGPGQWRFDANLQKSFKIGESKTLQFRMDARNILNHPEPNTPPSGDHDSRLRHDQGKIESAPSVPGSATIDVLAEKAAAIVGTLRRGIGQPDSW